MTRRARAWLFGMVLLPHQAYVECGGCRPCTREAAAHKPASSCSQSSYTHRVFAPSPDPRGREPGMLCSSCAVAEPMGEPRGTSSPLCSLSPKATVFFFIVGTTVTALSHPSSPPAPQPQRPRCRATLGFLGSEPGCAGGLSSPLPPATRQIRPQRRSLQPRGRLPLNRAPAPHCRRLRRDVPAQLLVPTARDPSASHAPERLLHGDGFWVMPGWAGCRAKAGSRPICQLLAVPAPDYYSKRSREACCGFTAQLHCCMAAENREAQLRAASGLTQPDPAYPEAASRAAAIAGVLL